MDSLYKALLEV